MKAIDNGKKTTDKPVWKNLNLQVYQDSYELLQEASGKLGGMSLSALVRVGLDVKIAKYKETRDPKVFLEDL